mgnify:CR=1 FL=1
MLVAPHTGAWIETSSFNFGSTSTKVAPHTGAWIETFKSSCSRFRAWVAPHTGAWIETVQKELSLPKQSVAPHTGAWIETSHLRPALSIASTSLPIRERGLKHAKTAIQKVKHRRSPYGSVD